MKDCVWVLQQCLDHVLHLCLESLPTAFQTALLSSRWIPGGHIISPPHVAPLLCLKHRNTHLLMLMHAYYSQWVVSYPSLSPVDPVWSMHLQTCVVRDLDGQRWVACICFSPGESQTRRLTLLWTRVRSCWQQHQDNLSFPSLLHSERLWSAPNRKQTPLIADSCPWLMILIQFPKPVFFSSWNVSSVLPWTIILIALCWHPRLARWVLCRGFDMHTRTGKQASLESFSRNQTRLGENDSYSSYAFMSAAEIFSKWSPGDWDHQSWEDCFCRCHTSLFVLCLRVWYGWLGDALTREINMGNEIMSDEETSSKNPLLFNRGFTHAAPSGNNQQNFPKQLSLPGPAVLSDSSHRYIYFLPHFIHSIQSVIENMHFSLFLTLFSYLLVRNDSGFC